MGATEGHDSELDALARYATRKAIVRFGGEVEGANGDDRHRSYRGLGWK